MEGTNIYAIVDIKGKQYRVTPGQTIDVDRLSAVEGEEVQFDKVLALGGGPAVAVGAPYVAGARVVATSHGEERGRKITVYKYKAKTRYRRKTGHHQLFTRLTVDRIVTPGDEQAAPAEEGGQEEPVNGA